MRLWGCAIDARRCSARKFSEATWRTDPRMRLVDVRGHRIRILEAGEARGAPPVLLAADAPVVLEHLLPLVESLCLQRHVVALEMPGFGFSRPTPAYRFTLPEQLDVLEGLLDALDLVQVHLAFTCINALLAAALARRAQARVARLTLGQLPSLAEYRRWAARIDMKVAGVPLLATPGVGQALMAAAPAYIAGKWFRGVSGPKADVAELTRVASKVYADGGMFCLAALNQSMTSVTEADVGPVEVPTTFLWGTADRSHRATERDSYRVLAPDAEVVHLDGLGHCFDLEDPGRVAPWLL